MIIDTSVLIAILRRETGFENYLRFISNASDQFLISSATALEAHIVVQRFKLEGLEENLIQLLDDLGLQIVDFSAAQLAIAIEAHRNFGRGSGHKAQLNFGDCFAYALAKDRGKPLLFKGNDFTHTDVTRALP